jgi:hypothetical protein
MSARLLPCLYIVFEHHEVLFGLCVRCIPLHSPSKATLTAHPYDMQINVSLLHDMHRGLPCKIRGFARSDSHNGHICGYWCTLVSTKVWRFHADTTHYANYDNANLAAANGFGFHLDRLTAIVRSLLAASRLPLNKQQGTAITRALYASLSPEQMQLVSFGS